MTGLCPLDTFAGGWVQLDSIAQASPAEPDPATTKLRVEAEKLEARCN